MHAHNLRGPGYILYLSRNKHTILTVGSFYCYTNNGKSSHCTMGKFSPFAAIRYKNTLNYIYILGKKKLKDPRARNSSP